LVCPGTDRSPAQQTQISTIALTSRSRFIIFPIEREEETIELRVCLLGSGSGGNTTYIGYPGNGKRAGAGILIDAGLPAGQIVSRLRAIQVDLRQIKAVLITHEHHDHIHGAGPLALNYNIPIYANEETRRAAKRLRKLPVPIHLFETGASFWIDPFSIHPFPISHDAADPVGYTVQTDRHKVGMVTDLGCLTPSLDALRECDLLILESNYDPEMLLHGPYPPHIKKRVLGDQGHLSNADSATLLQSLLHPRLKTLYLAHLSQKNNLPHLAYQSAEAILRERGESVQLHLGWQDFISPVTTLS
jgi:phosphoribosyl 1,2-cyclic phosphodiesterase